MEYKWLTQGESLREWRRMYWQRPHNPLVLVQIPVQTPNSQFSPLPVSPPWQLQVCMGFSSVQSLSCVQLFATPWTAAGQASLSTISSQSLLKLMSFDLVMPSNHLILCHPRLLLLSIFPESGSFQKSQFFTSGGQSIGASASASVLPMTIQDWFPLGLAGLISLQSKELSRVFSNTTVQKHKFFGTQLSFWSNSHIHIWLLEKPQLWLYTPLSVK